MTEPSQLVIAFYRKVIRDALQRGDVELAGITFDALAEYRPGEARAVSDAMADPVREAETILGATS